MMVPMDGLWSASSDVMVTDTISSLLEGHLRACHCLDLQLWCLQAGATSSIGYGVIEYLQEGTLESYHSGKYEE